MTLRKFAEALRVSAPYLSDIENGHRKPLHNFEKLDAICKILQLCKDDQHTLFDLAGAGRDEVAPDINAYIKRNPHVAHAIRNAMEQDVQENEWRDFVANFMKRRE